jgi:hypothetical protein
LHVEATISMVLYCNRTAPVMSELFAVSQRMQEWARMPVQKALYTLGLDYRQGSVAGWMKALAPYEAAGLI